MNHSYSSLKLYAQCPQQWYQVRILKRFPKVDTEATLYGTKVHKFAEELVRDGKEPAEKFPGLDAVRALKALKGEKHCELMMGVTQNLEPCSFDAADVWLRGIADLAIVNAPKARVCDYKSGSDKYPDIEQLELMALFIFKHFPEVKIVDGALIFLKTGTIVPRKPETGNGRYFRGDEMVLWSKWARKIQQIERSLDAEVFNKCKSGLCPYCPYTECENWTPPRPKRN